MRSPSLFSKLFLLLVAMATLPFLTIVFLSDSDLLATFETEANRIGQGRLEDARNTGESVSDSARAVCLGIAVDPRMDQFEAIPRLDEALHSPEASWFLLQFQEGLEDRVRTNDMLQSITLRLDGTDYVVDSLRGTYRRSEASTRATPTGEASGWSPGTPLTYVYPLSSFLTKTQGSLEVVLDERRFSKRINSDPDAGSISLRDSRGIILSHPDPKMVGTQTLDDLGSSTPAGSRLVDTPHGKVLLSWMSRGLDGWVWFGEFPLQSLTKSLQTRRTLTLAVSFSIFVAALLLAFLVSRRYFRPMRDLLSSLRDRRELGEPGEGNEFQLLSRSFDTLRKNEDQLFTRLQASKEKALEAWILTCLEGVEPSSVPDPFVHPWFQCLLILVDHPQVVRERFPEAPRQLLSQAVLGAALEALGRDGTIGRGVLRGDHRLILVLNLPDPTLLDRTQACRRLTEETRPLLGTTLTFCWGDSHRTAGGFVQSWNEAQALLEVRFLHGKGTILFPQDRPTQGEERPLPGELVQRLLAGIESGRMATVQGTMERILDQIREHSGSGQGQARLRLYQVAAGLLTWMSENGITPEKVFGPGFHLYQNLADQETLDEAAAWLVETCGRLAEHQREGQSSEKDHASRLLNLIWDRYRTDLDIESLARLAGLSVSHARRIFTREVGGSILNYVNRLRIDDAEHLLRHTDLTLEQIALSVGYHNTQSLQRFFKKFVGTSPGEFRASLRKGLSGSIPPS